jgi:hypothetical protein
MHIGVHRNGLNHFRSSINPICSNGKITIMSGKVRNGMKITVHIAMETATRFYVEVAKMQLKRLEEELAKLEI